jgi:hypothetical protein
MQIQVFIMVIMDELKFLCQLGEKKKKNWERGKKTQRTKDNI